MADRRNPSPLDRIVGQRLRAARELRKLSQERLGEMLGVSFQQIQKYEKGTNRLSATRVHEIAEVLSLPVEVLYEGSRGADDASDEVEMLRAVLAVTDPTKRRLIAEMARALADNAPPAVPAPPSAATGAKSPNGPRRR
jgi:transcriptional regulator with XRE-family HTH domain